MHKIRITYLSILIFSLVLTLFMGCSKDNKDKEDIAMKSELKIEDEAINEEQIIAVSISYLFIAYSPPNNNGRW